MLLWILSKIPKWRPFKWFLSQGNKKSHRDWNPANRVAEKPQECFFLPKINWWRLPCDVGHCRGAASKCVQCLVTHMPPFSRVFQGLPHKKFDWQFVLVAQIPYGQSPDCQKNKLAQFDFRFAHSPFLGKGRFWSVPLPNLAFCLGVILQNPWFITCDNMTDEFWLPLKAVQKISRHTSLQLAFCSVMRFFETILAHTFLMSKSCVKILWTVNQFKFNSLLIILNVNQWSDLTRDLTLSTLSSVFEVEGLPALCSSSTCSQPSKKDLCHLNNCAPERECSP